MTRSPANGVAASWKMHQRIALSLPNPAAFKNWVWATKIGSKPPWKNYSTFDIWKATCVKSDTRDKPQKCDIHWQSVSKGPVHLLKSSVPHPCWNILMRTPYEQALSTGCEMTICPSTKVYSSQEKPSMQTRYNVFWVTPIPALVSSHQNFLHYYSNKVFPKEK